jgi:hypothetical protein
VVLFDGILAGTMLGAFAEKSLEGITKKVASGAANTLIVVPLAQLILLVAAMGLIKTVFQTLKGRLKSR